MERPNQISRDPGRSSDTTYFLVFKSGCGGEARDQEHQCRGAEVEGALPNGLGFGEAFRENLENSDPRANPSSTSLRQLQPWNRPEPKGNPGTDQENLKPNS